MEIGVIELLKDLGDGNVLDDLHNALAEVKAMVRQCRRKGTVTLVIDVSTAGDDSEMQRLKIHGDVSCKPPKLRRHSKLYYIDDDLALHSRDPRQRQLPNMINMQDAVDGKSRAAGERQA